MWRYFELLSFRPATEIEALSERVRGGENPRDIKFLLAEEIVARFHDEASAVRAREEFIARFQRGALPADIEEVNVAAPSEGLGVAHVLKAAGLVASTSEALRMISQGAVRIDGERIEDRKLTISAGFEGVFQVGKRRVARVSVTGA